ncbi:unnamed protein product [Protopolystoma xenopodis]|uniref:Uncharacterized protein n=1 Tax=Protopolystoma xenopodis TaxID=117903 RepID=A0A3S5C5Z3_9PLAT|nr:unnamed protein product [Protopolystoma xenopodis]
MHVSAVGIKSTIPPFRCRCDAPCHEQVAQLSDLFQPITKLPGRQADMSRHLLHRSSGQSLHGKTVRQTNINVCVYRMASRIKTDMMCTQRGFCLDWEYVNVHFIVMPPSRPGNKDSVIAGSLGLLTKGPPPRGPCPFWSCLRNRGALISPYQPWQAFDIFMSLSRAAEVIIEFPPHRRPKEGQICDPT